MAAKTEHWIFLRGLFREAGHWHDLMDDFKKQFPQAEVETLDLPGTGQNRHEQVPLSILGNLEYLRSISAARKQNKKVWLLSISLGSMVALEWALRYPEEIEGVVCINTSIGGLSPVYQRMTPLGLSQIFRSLAEKNPVLREEVILQMITNLRRPLRPIAEKFAQISSERPIEKGTAIKQLLAASRYRLRSDPPQVPLLLLRSLGDRLVSPQCTMSLARYWNLDCKTHPSAGHDLPLDDSQWLLEKVGQWKAQVSAL